MSGPEPMSETFILYHGPVTRFGAEQVEEACVQMLASAAQGATLLICSAGGDVTAGIGIYNFLRMMPFEIKTHAFGMCGSIAATIFLAGKKRTCSAASYFSLHAASYSEGPRIGQVAETTHMISAPFASELRWSNETIGHYFGAVDEKFLTSDDAKKLGILHEVSEPKLTADDLIVRINPDAPAAVSLERNRCAAVSPFEAANG